MLRKIFFLVLTFALVVPCAYAREKVVHPVLRVSDLSICPAGRSCVDGSGNMKMGSATIGQTGSISEETNTMTLDDGDGAPITLQDIRTATSGGDATAIHDNQAGEINAVSQEDSALEDGDVLIGENAQNSYAKIKILLSEIWTYINGKFPAFIQTLLDDDNATEFMTTLAGQDLSTSGNPSFTSVHSSGGNLAAANRQVTKAWQTGLPYVADLTAVVYGGALYVCTSSHTAGSTTEPGVGASWETVWLKIEGADMPTITAFAETVLDDDNVTEMRSTLGLGAAATLGTGTLTDTYVCVYSTASGLVCNTDPATLGGGFDNLTDFDTQTAYRIFYSDANGDVTELALGADGEYLKSNGASAAPSWATPSGAAHDAVTLSTDLGNNLLGLSTQQITLDNQTANYIFAGPATGAAAAPAFRALVDTDIPSAIARDTELHAAVTLGSGIGGLTLSTQELGLSARLEAYHDFVDPNADRIWFWDDSAGAFAALTAGTGLTISDTTITVNWAAPGAIGGTTPAAGTFTTVTAASFVSTAADGSRMSTLPNNTTGNEPSITAGESGLYSYETILYLYENGSKVGAVLANTDINTAAKLETVGGLGAFFNEYGDDDNATEMKTTLGLENVDNTSDATKNAASATLTNKTLDANGTGNVLKGYGYITFTRPHNRGSATGAVGTTETTQLYGVPSFADDVETNNYVDYIGEVPRDWDSAVDPVAYFKFRLGGADTADHDYIVSMIDTADSGSADGTPADAINLAFTADASGASGDIETATATLTGWGAAATAGSYWLIRVYRDGDDGTNDASTVDSYPMELTIRYGFTQ